jgi:hypothetical protein
MAWITFSLSPCLRSRSMPISSVRAVHLAVDRLADVVHQAGAAGDVDVGLQLGRHHAGQEGDRLDRRAGARSGRSWCGSLQPAEQLDQLGVAGPGCWCS